MIAKFKSAYGLAVEFIWAIYWLGLSFTSFPILAWIFNSQAAPLSAIPLGILMVIWFIPAMVRGASLPAEVKPILLFTLVAIASSAAVYYLPAIPYEGRTYVGQSLRALLTLTIGLSFYLVTAAWFREEAAIQRALRWIHVGGAIMLLWGMVQIVIIFTAGGHFPAFLEHVREWLVVQYYAVREGNRVASLAYEPSWFAHQMNLLYLPLWLAATYLKQSVFRIRILRLSIENILLGVGLVEFILSHPRVGLMAFLLVVFYLLVRIDIRLARSLAGRFSLKGEMSESRRTVWKTLLTVGIGLLLPLLFLGIVYGGLRLGARFDERFESLFTPIPPEQLFILKAMNEETLLYLGHRLMFLERVIYWLSGWHIFRDYPILGVGLGNTGFFVSSHMPQIGWMTTELRDLFYRFGYVINTKSYWIRLLAETGLVGFAFFTTWLVGIWRSARYLGTRPEKIYNLVGLASQLALIAFLVEGFSLDSFTLPYLWILPGIVSAARMATFSKGENRTIRHGKGIYLAPE